MKDVSVKPVLLTGPLGVGKSHFLLAFSIALQT
jgi:DNA replication protein DnaC